MTLGPTIALMPVLERARGAVAGWLAVFGRVPFFFYVLHIPLIHALALVVSAIRQGSVSPWLFANHPMGNPPPPDGYAWSLGLLYLVWAIAIVIAVLRVSLVRRPQGEADRCLAEVRVAERRGASALSFPHDRFRIPRPRPPCRNRRIPPAR